MASGIAVHDDCVQAYKSFKLDKKKYFIVFKIAEDGKQIVVDEECDGGCYRTGFESFKDYFTKLNEKQECRYAVVDFHYETSEGQPRDKLIFVHFAPDDAKMKKKMLSASSKGALKMKLDGAATELQANDLDSLDESSFLTMKEIRGQRIACHQQQQRQ